jgi:hypothetical protein
MNATFYRENKLVGEGFIPARGRAAGGRKARPYVFICGGDLGPGRARLRVHKNWAIPKRIRNGWDANGSGVPRVARGTREALFLEKSFPAKACKADESHAKKQHGCWFRDWFSR